MALRREALILSMLALVVSVTVGDSYGEIIRPDRRIDWEPGIPGGIPTRTTICANVKNSPYNAKGDGVTDDTTAIRNAINACPSGQVVYIPEGTYKLNSEIIIGKGIVIRGAGTDKTRLKSYASSGSILRFQGTKGSTTANIVSGYTKGSTTITVDNASGFNAGNYVIIDQLNDPSFVSANGASGLCGWCSRGNGSRAMGQIVKITSKSGNTLTIGRPLYLSLSASYDPEIILLSSNPPVNAGVEDLYIEKTSGGGRSNIMFERCIYSWIKNIESYKAGEEHVRLYSSYGCVVRDSYFHHSLGYSGGYGYGLRFIQQPTDNLVENNIFYFLRHQMIFGGGGAGNVIAYNYSLKQVDPNYPNTNWQMADMVTHGAHPYMNLFEGNIAAKLCSDFIWGSSSHNTYLRNHIERQNDGEEMRYGVAAVELQKYNRYANLVGNVFCTSSCPGLYESYPINSSSDKRIYKLGLGNFDSTGYPVDSAVSSTLLRHGNYDYVTLSTVWDSGIADHNLPDSYYLASKPAFFGNLPWPAIGPDLKPVVGTLPAKARFLGVEPDIIAPSPPRNLRIVH